MNGVGEASVSALKSKAPLFLERLNIMREDALRTGNVEAGELVGYGENLKAIIEGFTGAADTVGNIVESVQYGITHPFGYALPGLDGISRAGLGLLPVLAVGQLVTLTSIAGAAAAVTAITYYITKADRVHAEIMAGEWEVAQKRAQELAAQGDGKGAQNIIDEFNRVQVATRPQNIAGTISGVVSAAVVIGIIYMMMKGKNNANF